MVETTLRQPELDTPQLRLRGLQPADAALLALYGNDLRIARMTNAIPHPYPPGLAESYIARARAPEARELVWALDAGAGSENGLVGLIALKRAGESAGVGYWVAPAFWGTGYAGEAVEAVADFAAGEGIQALTAQVFQDNLASVRVLTRAGFAFVGTGETYSLGRGAMVPTFRYRRALGAGA